MFMLLSENGFLRFHFIYILSWFLWLYASFKLYTDNNIDHWCVLIGKNEIFFVCFNIINLKMKSLLLLDLWDWAVYCRMVLSGSEICLFYLLYLFLIVDILFCIFCKCVHMHWVHVFYCIDVFFCLHMCVSIVIYGYSEIKQISFISYFL